MNTYEKIATVFKALYNEDARFIVSNKFNLNTYMNDEEYLTRAFKAMLGY